MSHDRTFANAPESVVRARRFVLEALGGLTAEMRDRVAVMVSELATNSVLHAASEFTVSVERDERSLRVSVTDHGDRLPSLRAAGPNDRSGRGLQIVEALSDEWGVTKLAGGVGKTVWFVVALQPAPSQSDASSAAAQRSPSSQPGSDTATSSRRVESNPARGAEESRHERRARSSARKRRDVTRPASSPARRGVPRAAP